MLELSTLAIRVVVTVGHYDVVEKMQSHGVTGTLHLLGDLVVVATWIDVAAWMVVGKGYDSGVAQYGFLNDKAHVNGSLCYSTV